MSLDSLPYRATVSGTRFAGLPPDPEDVPLEDYRRAERERLGAFLDRDEERVLVMGGVSGTGKTHLTQVLAEERGLPLLYSRDDLSKALGRTAPALLIEEGDLFVERQGAEAARRAVASLLNKYPKLVLLGGGVKRTSDEQTALIVEALGLDPPPATFPFELKPLSMEQGTQLVQRSPLGIYQQKPLPEERLLPRPFAQRLMELIPPHHRLLREILKISMMVWWAIEEDLPFSYIRYEQYFPEGKDQEEELVRVLTEAREELLDLLLGSGHA